jgi:hypothetical protein
MGLSADQWIVGKAGIEFKRERALPSTMAPSAADLVADRSAKKRCLVVL